MSSYTICIASMGYCSSLHGYPSSVVLRYIFSIYHPFFLSVLISKEFLPQAQKLRKNKKISYNIPAVNTSATPEADLVLATPSESAIAPLQRRAAWSCRGALWRPDSLQRVIIEHSKTLNGPQRLQLVANVL